ncbi:MAG: hypothetical protein VCE75_04390 [Alphaproteobacteria bacterium]
MAEWRRPLAGPAWDVGRKGGKTRVLGYARNIGHMEPAAVFLDVPFELDRQELWFLDGIHDDGKDLKNSVHRLTFAAHDREYCGLLFFRCFRPEDWLHMSAAVMNGARKIECRGHNHTVQTDVAVMSFIDLKSHDTVTVSLGGRRLGLAWTAGITTAIFQQTTLPVSVCLSHFHRFLLDQPFPSNLQTRHNHTKWHCFQVNYFLQPPGTSDFDDLTAF